jgi:hypothetical protein
LALDPELVLAEAITTGGSGLAYEPGWTADQAGEFRNRWRAVAAANLPARA